MSFSALGLLGGLIFSTLGIYFFKSGKKDSDLRLFAIGVILFLYPYFIGNDWLLWGIGLSLTVIGIQLSRK